MKAEIVSRQSFADIPYSWGLSPAFLKYAAGLVLGASLSFVLIVHLSSPEQPLRIVAPIVQVLISVVTLVLMARGRLAMALATMVWATWAIMATVLVFYGGVRGTPVVIFPLLIMICGWLLGPRSAIVMGALSAAATLGLVVAENLGILPASPDTPPELYGLIQVWCIVLTTFLIVSLVRAYSRRLAEVERLSRDLAQRTAEAQTIAADLTTAQSVARIGSWVYDFSSDAIEMSPETRRIFGLGNAALGNRTGYFKRVDPDDLPALERECQAALAGKPLLSEHRIRIGNKSRWVRQRGEVEFDADGKPWRCVGTTQDISGPKIAEQELRIAATAFESQEGMVITDAGGRILRINKAFTRITGYAIDAVAGQSPRLLRSGRHDAAFYAAMWEAIDASGSWQGEIWNRRKCGEVYPQWLTITAVKNGEALVTNYVGTLTDITARKAAEDEIRTLAFYDPLTRLPNRRLLLDRLQQALAASTRSGRQGALMFMDLDNFKGLNDSQGHDQGDLLLQQVGQRLSTCVREGDTVSRFGGDEFVAMLANLSVSAAETATQADKVAKKIIALLAQPYDLGGQPYRGTVSIGVTVIGDQQTPLPELLKQADQAMYEAKAKGRNTICFYRHEMTLRPTERGGKPA